MEESKRASFNKSLSIPINQEFIEVQKQKRLPNKAAFRNDGGGRWIRTTEGGAVRFTV